MRPLLLVPFLFLAPFAAADVSVGDGPVHVGTTHTSNEGANEFCSWTYESHSVGASAAAGAERVEASAAQYRSGSDCAWGSFDSDMTSVSVTRTTEGTATGASASTFDAWTNDVHQCDAYVYAFALELRPGCTPNGTPVPVVLNVLP